MNGGWYIYLFVVGKSMGESGVMIFQLLMFVMHMVSFSYFWCSWCDQVNEGGWRFP